MAQTTKPFLVPVSVSKLLGHLDAYDNNKHVITTLRLCNRRGDTGAPITKLPTELIDMIVEELELDTFDEGHKRWDQAFACYEERCEPKTDLKASEIRTIVEHHRRHPICYLPLPIALARINLHSTPFSRDCAICRGVLDSYDPSSLCKIPRRFTPDDLIDMGYYLHKHRHHQNAGREWVNWFSEVFRYDLEEILRRDFGLETMILEKADGESFAAVLTGQNKVISLSELTRLFSRAMRRLKLEPISESSWPCMPRDEIGRGRIQGVPVYPGFVPGQPH